MAPENSRISYRVTVWTILAVRLAATTESLLLTAFFIDDGVECFRAADESEPFAAVGFFAYDADDGLELNTFWLDYAFLFILRVVLYRPCSLSYSLALVLTVAV